MAIYTHLARELADDFIPDLHLWRLDIATAAEWAAQVATDIGVAMAACYCCAMNLLVLVVVLLLLFGGGGFYFGGPAIGGGGLGLVLLICPVIFFMGGFRAKKAHSPTKDSGPPL